jgi:hypothetical protein
MKKNAASKRPEAERAGEHYAREVMGCVLTRRALRTKYAKVDFFASDVVGKRPNGTHVYLQVTAGQDSAVTARRRKLEAIPWHPTDTVQLLQLVQTPDPANGRRTLWFFRVHEYGSKWLKTNIKTITWRTYSQAVPVPRVWFKAFKESPEEHE